MPIHPYTTLTNDFVADHRALFSQLIAQVPWNEQMGGRKSAAFGVAFDDAPAQGAFPDALRGMADRVAEQLGWTPNSCMLDYYTRRRSATGMHRDAVERLEPDTSIAVVSVGATRVMVFERDDGTDICGRELTPGSLLVMSLASQRDWRRAMPARPGAGPRVNVTFRRVRTTRGHAHTPAR